MYTLYINRSDKEIKVLKAKKSMQYLDFKEEVTKFNNNYFICAKRKPLSDKAKEIQTTWISELEQEINQIKEIKI